MKTEEDWIKVGETVFGASPESGGVLTVEQVQDPEWWKTIAPLAAKDGALPAPWLKDDPNARLLKKPVKELEAVQRVIPPGVMARHRASPLYPVQVPDFIGVQDRHYVDRTGLQQHRSIVDLMRYAALNQGGDDLASFDGFIPATFSISRNSTNPTKRALCFTGATATIDGFEFVVGERTGKRTLIKREAQHEYVFSEVQ